MQASQYKLQLQLSSLSSRVLANNFFLQGLWKSTNRNDSKTNSVFILCFYIFVFWSDWTQVLAESQSSVKHAVVQIFLGSFHIYGSLCHGCEDIPWTWIKLFNLSKGKKTIEFLIRKSCWRTEKVIGKKSQSGPIAPLSLITFLQSKVYVK